MSFDEMIAVLEKAFRLHGSGLRHRCGIRRGGRQVRVGVRAGHEENRRNRRTSRQGEERLEEHSAHRAEAGGTAGCDPAWSVPFRSGARRDLSPSARNPDANRTITINHDQKDVFDKVIDEYRKKGADAWSLTNPCSDFAADVWNRVTGEDMSSLWIWDTPSDLRDAIIKMNGSVNHKIVE